MLKASFSNPGEFEARMAAASPGLQIRALGGARNFCADLSLAALPRVALFSIESKNLAAARFATGDLWSVTLPISGGFRAAVGGAGSHHAFDANELFLLNGNRDFDYRAPGTSRVLVANVLAGDLQQKAAALAGVPIKVPAETISTNSPGGGALARFTHHLWAELQRPGGLWDCPTALAEFEDALVSLLAMAASAPEAGAAPPARRTTVRKAEDFLVRHLTRPVSRSDLAVAAGASIRTISRGFREHHGIGPMAWLRARRLEAAQRELQAADPGEVTVTEVALRFGFENPGRFAAEYRRRFGEPPSQTLRS